MLAETAQKATSAVAQLSYENWVSILLAAIAVLLAIVTLIVAIAGIAIALVGIWGFKGLQEFAQQRAEKAFELTLAKYPDAAKFIEAHEAMQELYRRMLQQVSQFKQEFDAFHQKSEAANEILERLNTRQHSDVTNGNGDSADKRMESVGPTYPGEEADPDDGGSGESHKVEDAHPTDPR